MLTSQEKENFYIAKEILGRSPNNKIEIALCLQIHELQTRIEKLKEILNA